MISPVSSRCRCCSALHEPSGAAKTPARAGVNDEPPDAAATTDGLDEWRLDTTAGGGKTALIQRLNVRTGQWLMITGAT